MSVSSEGPSGASGSTPGQDFDLNIAPIIDCFTVLIAYLLISASFVSIGFFDVGVSTTTEVAAPSQPPVPQEFMSVALKGGEGGRGLEIKLSGPENAVLKLPPKTGGARDIEGLKAELAKVRARWPTLSEASVNGDAQVEYQEMVQVVEALKKELTKVYVGD